MHASYASLGREFKTIFDDATRQMSEQQAEANALRRQIVTANTDFVQAGQESRQSLQHAMDEERSRSAADRANLLSQITSLINSSADTQESRVAQHITNAAKRVKTSEDEYSVAQQGYADGMDTWATKSTSLIESCVRSRETVKSKIKADWTTANEQTGNIKRTTEAVHGETVEIVNAQMAHMDTQLVALDEIISRVKAQNEQHHQAHSASLAQLASNVQQSYHSIGSHMDQSYKRTKDVDSEMRERTHLLVNTLPSLSNNSEMRQTLETLRQAVVGADLEEYVPTGQTPLKTVYTYPTTLPRTNVHDDLLNRVRSSSDTEHTQSPSKPISSPRKAHSSPSKSIIYTDAIPASPDNKTVPFIGFEQAQSAPSSRPPTASGVHSLREIDVNVATAPTVLLPADGGLERKILAPPLKRHHTNSSLLQQGAESKLPMKRAARMTVAGVAEGRENLGASIGPGAGRRLRTRGSN